MCYSALPLAHRDFSQLVLLSPQAMVSRDTGISIAGQPDRLNGLQIDGAANNPRSPAVSITTSSASSNRSATHPAWARASALPRVPSRITGVS